MNKQDKGNGKRGIEWCTHTWNPLGGCYHACRWQMPNGTIANCYAEDVADGVASKAYPYGFEHVYWNPKILDSPLRVKEPAKIFVGSMTDVLGHWQDEKHIQEIIDIARLATWHTFQFLTKNPKRALQFDWPDNCWIGTSSPPNFMWNKRLSQNQMERMLFTALDSLSEVDTPVRWMSIEPLSYDIGSLFVKWAGTSQRLPLEWAVIGAASNGSTYYQPEPGHLLTVLSILDHHEVDVFFKGNLRPSFEKRILARWREDMPVEYAGNVKTPPAAVFSRKSDTFQLSLWEAADGN